MEPTDAAKVTGPWRARLAREAGGLWPEPTGPAKVPGLWLARLAAGRRACGAPGFAANVPGSLARISAEGRRSAGLAAVRMRGA